MPYRIVFSEKQFNRDSEKEVKASSDESSDDAADRLLYLSTKMAFLNLSLIWLLIYLYFF